MTASYCEEFQRRLRINGAECLALQINIDVRYESFREPLSDIELSLLHGPMDGPGAIGPRAHAEILRLRAIVASMTRDSVKK